MGYCILHEHKSFDLRPDENTSWESVRAAHASVLPLGRWALAAPPTYRMRLVGSWARGGGAEIFQAGWARLPAYPHPSPRVGSPKFSGGLKSLQCA